MTNKPFKIAALIGVALMLTGCQTGGQDNPVQPTAGYYQTGTASWYGAEYQGRPTASGEPFDKNALTAAHRELAFNTWVEVNNLGNGRRVTVRINDRGPFTDPENRIIDLSERAADELGMKTAGLAQVALDIVAGP
ncbi:MAG: septal ring lytic transglycosylase RlpA family protein [Candidatus Riflebacteria bacterium]|jgi:rare lipoprotein A|nr:septal ring lytic transglycosylase RlpA family protein [Candidatus Riflebacteria bacterium]